MNAQKQIKELDGFRAIAIILVLNFHFGLYINLIPGFNFITGSGWVGVPLFFILSGFLISFPYINAYSENGAVLSFKQYFINRIFRIFPLYYISLALFLIFKSFNAFSIPLKDILYHLFFVHNFLEDYSKINSPYWSLAVEFQFYLIFPLLAVLIKIILKKKLFNIIYRHNTYFITNSISI